MGRGVRLLGRGLLGLGLCGLLPSCSLLFSYPLPPTTEVSCTNGLDDDGDGRIDCHDADCPCEERGEYCDDEVDNDRDGWIDRYDPRCWSDVTVERCASVGGSTVDLLDSADFDLHWSGALTQTVDDTGRYPRRYEMPIGIVGAAYQLPIGGAVVGTSVDMDVLYTPGGRTDAWVILGGIGGRRDSAEVLLIGVTTLPGVGQVGTVEIRTAANQLVGRVYRLVPMTGAPMWLSFHVEIHDTVVATIAGTRLDLGAMPTSWTRGEPLAVSIETLRYEGEPSALGMLSIQRGQEQPCARPVPSDETNQDGELLGAARGDFVCASVRRYRAIRGGWEDYYTTARSDDGGRSYTDLGNFFPDLPADVGELTQMRSETPIAWDPLRHEFVGAVALTRARNPGEVVRPPLGDLAILRSSDCVTFRAERTGMTLPTMPFGDGEIALVGDDAVRADPAEIVIDATGRMTVFLHVLDSNDLATLTSPDGTAGSWTVGARMPLLSADEGGYVRHEDHLTMLGDDVVLVDRSSRDGVLTLWVQDPVSGTSGPWRQVAVVPANVDPTRFDASIASGILLPGDPPTVGAPLELTLLYSGRRPSLLSAYDDSFGDALLRIAP